jgi:GNAT superfamily N-acetyltransferase
MDSYVRRLTMDDYEAIIRVWADSGITYRPTGRDSKERLTHDMEREDPAYFGYFERDRMLAVGLATVDGRKGWINRVAVDPDRRREGLAVKIVEACEAFLKERGALIVACLIEDFNFPSMALFAKMGYLHTDDVHYFSKRESPDV